MSRDHTPAESRAPYVDPAGRLSSRVRMPFTAAAVVAVVVVVLADAPFWARLAALVAMLLAMSLYVRMGTPRGRAVDIALPVRGRWLALNSPSTRVPSHRINAWSQTYALDLVYDPPGDSGGGGRPAVSWWPPARRPQAYPGYGQPVRSPVDGTVVRAVDGMRDHWTRTSPISLVYFVLESLRELAGPRGVLGNHLVIRRDDGPCVLLAHLRRRSLRASRGDRVRAGDAIAECGNSGNSTEPHLHVQVMDRASPWLAAGIPMVFDGVPAPADGERVPAMSA